MNDGPVTVDGEGRACGPRVVSLVPSVTETLREWGRDPVACTRFCEQPDLPTVGGTKNPDIAAIVALAPDVVVVDAEENRREDHDALVAAGLSVHALHVIDVDGVGPQLAALADRLGVDWTPVPLPQGPAALPEWPATPPDRPGPAGGPVRVVAVPIWRRPWMFLGPGTYGASVLARLGWAVTPDDSGRYPRIEPAGLIGHRGAPVPELVLVPSEPYEFTDAHLSAFAGVAPWRRVDGRDLFWWGTRTPGALHRLATVLGS